jgi:hypothetical protein
VSRARRALETLLSEAGSRHSNGDHDIPAEKAFDDILEQATVLAGGPARRGPAE